MWARWCDDGAHCGRPMASSGLQYAGDDDLGRLSEAIIIVNALGKKLV